ncbi:MAG: hypothetical protein LBN24_13705, partial [Mediterranea sp.]|nr:hypothetical protein [Mediterranea sp.]
MCKAKGILASLSVLLLSTTIGYANNRGVIEYPATYGSKTHLEEIRKIELTDTATVFYMTAYERPNDWFIILKDTHLTDPQGNRYTIRGTEGVPFGELYYMNQTGHISFRLFFPPLPADVTSVDYCNGNETATDQIWGIRLTNKPYKFKLPKGFEEASINKKATLPQPIIKNGTAHLEGSIFDYRPDLGKELKLYIYSALDPNSDNRQVSIHPDGTFSADIDLCTPAQVYVTYQGGYIPPCFIAPGETTRIVIDPYASTRKISLISMPRQPLLGAPVHYAGYLASLCLEMAEKVTLKPALRTYRTEQEYISFMKD